MTQRRPHTTAYRRDILWLAAMIHRLSGLLLAVFLPFHFLVLGLALHGEARLDGFLSWTASPWVKGAESLLVALLAVHLLGGLRVLLVEATTYRDRQKNVATAAFLGAGLVGLAFFALAR